MRPFLTPLLLLAFAGSLSAAPVRKVLFFSKSSGFEHSVISWSKGQPSHAEGVLLELGRKNNWEFVFSKDGSKFGKSYLSQFDAIFFYTTGDLTLSGTDKQPPMTGEGKQAIFDYVRSGKGFIGTHSATDTFHTDNESQKGPERFLNHGDKADPYARLIGAEFIIHGKQQTAKNRVIDPRFPGFSKVPAEFSLLEEWYSLKDFRSDLHVLTVIDSPAMQGNPYKRPAFPSTWARKEGDGRVWYTAMGHREDIWTSPVFQEILVGGITWAVGDAKADLSQNLLAAAPGAMTTPVYEAPTPTPAPAPKAR